MASEEEPHFYLRDYGPRVQQVVHTSVYVCAPVHIVQDTVPWDWYALCVIKKQYNEMPNFPLFEWYFTLKM